jgi:putative flippase GtrA
MTVLPFTRSSHAGTRASVDVDIAVPVYNEAGQLAASIRALRTFLDGSFPFTATITIVDNASTDDTWPIATALATTLAGVDALHLDEKGRGRALRAAWSRSTATVVCYMDVDLATGLGALLPLVAPLLSGHSDMAIGTRLGSGAHVVRGTRREFISRGYNLLLRSALRSSCTDAQCGFKALRRDAAAELLPLVEDEAWFFDTELLVAAQRTGFRIHEVPVDWVDDTDSRVEVLHTALMDLRGVWRLLGRDSRRRTASRTTDREGHDRPWWSAPGWGLPPTRTGWSRGAPWGSVPTPRTRGTEAGGPGDGGQALPVFSDELLRFAGVGVVSTLAYAGLFAALEPTMGSYWGNAVAIGLCSLGNTAAHRGMAGSARHGLDRKDRLATAAALLGVSLAFTTGALAATRAVGITSLPPELVAVSAANAGAAVIRFGILRTWVFRPQFGADLAPRSDAAVAGTHPHTPIELTRTPS